MNECLLYKNNLEYLQKIYDETYLNFNNLDYELTQLNSHIFNLQKQQERYNLDSTNLLNTLNYNINNNLQQNIYFYQQQYDVAYNLKYQTEMNLNCAYDTLQNKSNNHFHLKDKLYFIDHKYNLTTIFKEMIKTIKTKNNKNILNTELIVKEYFNEKMNELENNLYIESIIFNIIELTINNIDKKEKKRMKKIRKICKMITKEIINNTFDCINTKIINQCKIKKEKDSENNNNLNIKNINVQKNNKKTKKIKKKKKKKGNKKNKIPDNKKNDIDFLNQQIEKKAESNKDINFYRKIRMEQLISKWMEMNSNIIVYDYTKEIATLKIKIPLDYWKVYEINDRKFDPLIPFNKINKKLRIIPKIVEGIKNIIIVLGYYENEEEYLYTHRLTITLPNLINIDDKIVEHDFSKKILKFNDQVIRFELQYPLIENAKNLLQDKDAAKKNFYKMLNYTFKKYIDTESVNKTNEKIIKNITIKLKNIDKIVNKIKTIKFFDELMIQRINKNYIDLINFFDSKIKLLQNNFYPDKTEKEINKLINFNELIIFENASDETLYLHHNFQMRIHILKKLSEELNLKLDLFLLLNGQYKIILQNIKLVNNTIFENPIYNFKKLIVFMKDFVEGKLLTSKIGIDNQIRLVNAIEIEVYINIIVNELSCMIVDYTSHMNKDFFKKTKKYLYDDNIYKTDEFLYKKNMYNEKINKNIIDTLKKLKK